MPIVILLLIAIVLLLIGGPALLFGSALGIVTIPAYLVWATGLFKIVTWVLLALIAGSVLFLITITTRAKRQPPQVGQMSEDQIRAMQARFKTFDQKTD